MNMGRFWNRPRSPGRLALVSLLLGSFLVSVLASSSPALHHLLHHDSSAPVHQCLASKLSDGQNDVAPALFFLGNTDRIAPANVPPVIYLSTAVVHPDAPPRGPPAIS